MGTKHMDMEKMLEKKEKSNRIKELLVFVRDGLAYAFSWLVICVIAVSLLSGNDTISVGFLLKTLVLCLWGVIAFAVSFRNRSVQKKGFIFSLTLFYVLFIPIEIAMFYIMGIFSVRGNLISWIIFGVIIVLAYVISVLVDYFVMRKNAEIYTEKINEYVANKS